MEITSGVRTPDQVRRTGNRLRDESSLYLQQHARNPVDWYPWGEEALARARAEDRPIFLSSGYSSCHWCHVMEHEVFEHDDVAAALNQRFVCIKVDREERPDIDATYMQAVQMMTGGGGWPMSVFLTPDLEPFFGGTYIPHDRFLALLGRIDELWRTRRGDLQRQANELARQIRMEPAAQDTAPSAVDEDVLAAVAAGAVERFDEHHGGFAGPMKFPVPVRWVYLLHHWRRSGDPDARRLVERTCEAMVQGGLQDHVGGGFHRYTVDADWTVPHFEKMLYDNAQLASLLLEAGVALDRPDFTAAGVDVLRFLDREMCGDEGACYASFDADSGGEEGTYYVWTPAQLTAAVGPVDGPVLADLLGVTDTGNFEHGASVVTRRREPATVAARHGRRAAEVADLFDRHRDTLRRVRAQRTAPGLDRKVVTAWNGLAMSAFAHGYRVTGDQVFRRRAESIADYLARVHRDDEGKLLRASNAGRATGSAVLEDHALLAMGLLDLFQITGAAEHLAWAGELLAVIDSQFARDGGGWYDTAATADTPLGRRHDPFDSVIPSGSAITLLARLIHGALTGDLQAAEAVAEQLATRGDLMRRAGLEMAGWFDVALRLRGPRKEVVVAGDLGDENTTALYALTAGPLSPDLVVTPVPAGGAAEALLELAPVLKFKTATERCAQVYICERGSCQKPTSNSNEIKELLGLM